jgi:hypothetical protein
MDIITITYKPTVPVKANATEQIFAVWNPAATASDNEKFKNTYYQTNRWDKGEFALAQSLEAFLASLVAHPGLVAALRAAVRAYEADKQQETPTGEGKYDWEAPDGYALYTQELTPALKDQGFTLAPKATTSEESGSGEG